MVFLLGPIVPLIAIAVIVALVLIVQGIRGLPDLTDPRCRRCGYDVRGLDFTQPHRLCPECGSDLAAPGAIRFGEYRRRPRRILAGVAVLMVPVLVAGGLAAWQFFRIPGLTTASNAALIANLSTSANTPWDWQKLEDRYATGRLSGQEASAAVDQLILFLKNNPSRTGQPLSWGGSFLKAAMARGDVSSEQLGQLASVFYGPPKMKLRPRWREFRKVEFGVEGPSPWELPGVKFVWALREVRLDGSPIEVYDRISQKASRHTLSGVRHGHANCTLDINPPPGQHELAFEFDTGLVPENATFDPRYNGAPGQMERWPSPLVKQSQTVKLTVEVFAHDSDMINLVTDPARDPSRSITVPRLLVIPEKNGLVVQTDISRNGAVPVPLSCKVYLVLGEARHELGWFGADGHMTSRTDLRRQVSSFPADLTKARLVLEPDVKQAEERLLVTEIWGKPIEKDAPVERLKPDE